MIFIMEKKWNRLDQDDQKGQTGGVLVPLTPVPIDTILDNMGAGSQ